jgi:hypothetical protein
VIVLDDDDEPSPQPRPSSSATLMTLTGASSLPLVPLVPNQQQQQRAFINLVPQGGSSALFPPDAKRCMREKIPIQKRQRDIDREQCRTRKKKYKVPQGMGCVQNEETQKERNVKE